MSTLNLPDVRDAPTREFIESLRRRYPIEPEIDRLLIRKMERRSGPSYSMASLATLSDALVALLRDTLDSKFEVSDACWLAGGASKLQMRFTLRWNEPLVGTTTSDLVVRMEPSESINASSRLREFELLRALHETVPVPKVYWVDADAKWFPEPALIYAYAHGVAKPTTIASGSVTGIGTNFGPRLRKLLAPQFVDHLARIHTFDHEHSSLDSFSRSPIGSPESAQLQINRTLRVWEEDRGEEFSLMDVAANWLARNVPLLDRASVIHGDYRAGNFLFDEASGQITAVLDWERAYIGDRHRDLAWSTARVIGHMAEDGKTYLICGLMPIEEFHDRYQQSSGLKIDPVKLQFYEVLNRYQQVTTVLGTAYRVVRLSKSHQNIVVARLQTAAYLLAEELRSALQEVL